MRLIRMSILGLLVSAVAAAPVIAATGPEYRDAARTALRRAIKAETAASHNVPSDLDAAKEWLDSAAEDLSMFDSPDWTLPGQNNRAYAEIRERGSLARAFDMELSRSDNPDTASDESGEIDKARADGKVTQEEVERIQWVLRTLLEMKREGLDIADEIEFKETGKKPTPNTKVGAPQCQSGDQQVSVMSSCYTVDIWRIFVPRSSRAAICKFVDDDGERLTNVRPLFEGVIQETTCRLTDQTVVVNGVTKRVVRATLKLSALSTSQVRGTADVRVVALYR